MKKAYLTELVEKDPNLIWYVTNKNILSDKSIFEHILNFGTWEQVKKAIQILGFNKARQIYFKLAKAKRTNLKTRVKHYFNLYFANESKSSN